MAPDLLCAIFYISLCVAEICLIDINLTGFNTPQSTYKGPAGV